MFKICIFLYTAIVLSHELIINDPMDGDMQNYYEIDNSEKFKEMPIIVREINRGDIQPIKYKLVLPKENQYNNEDIFKDYFIIKSTTTTMDVVPYALIKRLDKIKYMILWLNLYCDMHPDCDKSVLNEELRKVVSTVEDNQKQGKISSSRQTLMKK